ncbi:MAG: hypothetical protein H6733_00920 [Alphaproteobacteria bacterium]|nr:hypothetical protein [Alphaproteobacteria bacterium]
MSMVPSAPTASVAPAWGTPALVQGAPMAGPVAWHVLVVVAVAAAIAWALRPSRDSGVLHRAWPWLVLGSALPRLLLPGAWVHVDGDDVALLSTIRGLDPHGLRESTTQFGAIAVGLHQALRGVFGDTYDVIFLPARFASTLVPALGARLAWRWTRDRAQALVVALVLAVWPVYLSSGVSTHLEVPAAALILGGTVLLLETEGRGALAWLFGAAGTALMFALAAGFKEEMALWVALWSVALVGAPGTPLQRGARLGTVGVAALAAVALSWDSTSQAGGLATRRASMISVEHVAIYVVVGFGLVNPPWPPLSWAFVRGLVRPPRSDLRPAQLAVLGLVGMYASAVRILGPNHLRYAMASLPLLALCVAPDLLRWWRDRHTPRHRVALGLVVVGWMIGVGWWGWQLRQPRERDMTWLMAHPPPADTLVLYPRHGEDRSVGPTVQAMGATRTLPDDGLWPPSCPPALALRRVRLRTSFKDLSFRQDLPTARFQDTARLDEDLAWWQAQPLRDDLAAATTSLVRSLRQAEAAVDPARCAADLEEVRALLATTQRLVVYVDALSAPDRFDRMVNGLAPDADDRPGEAVTVLLGSLSAQPRPVGQGWVEVDEVPDPLDPAGAPVWRRDDR